MTKTIEIAFLVANLFFGLSSAAAMADGEVGGDHRAHLCEGIDINDPNTSPQDVDFCRPGTNQQFDDALCVPWRAEAERILKPAYCNIGGRESSLIELDHVQRNLLSCDGDMGNSSDTPNAQLLSFFPAKEWQLKGRTSSSGNAGAFREMGYGEDPCH